MSKEDFHKKYAHDYVSFCLDMLIPACGTKVSRFRSVAEEWQIRDMSIMQNAVSKIWRGPKCDETPYRNVWLTRPRGHDKTSSIARLLLWILAFDCRYRKTVPLTCYAAAVDKEQAFIVYDCMRTLAEINRYPVRFRRSGRVSGPGGQLFIISSDAASSYGLVGHVFVFDEITQWNTPSSKDFFDSLWSGRGKVKDSCTFVMTNSGYRNTWQYELLQVLKKDATWYVYDEPGRLASWSVVTNDMIAGLSKEKVDMLFYNQWIDEPGANLYELFMSCCDSSREPRSDDIFCVVISVDYATSRDLFVMTTAYVSEYVYYANMVSGRFSPSEIEKMIYDEWEKHVGSYPTFVVSDRYQMEYMSEVLFSKGCVVELLKPTRNTNKSMMYSFVDMMRNGMIYFSSPYLGLCYGTSLETDFRKCVFDYEHGKVVGDCYDDRIVSCMYVIDFLIRRKYVNTSARRLDYDSLKSDFGTNKKKNLYLDYLDASRLTRLASCDSKPVFGLHHLHSHNSIFGIGSSSGGAESVYEG